MSRLVLMLAVAIGVYAASGLVSSTISAADDDRCDPAGGSYGCDHNGSGGGDTDAEGSGDPDDDSNGGGGGDDSDDAGDPGDA
jgi:hypothetical protein